MTLRFIEGFDHLLNSVTGGDYLSFAKWTTGGFNAANAPSTQTGRYGGSAIQFLAGGGSGFYLTKGSLPNMSTVFIGVALQFKVSTNPFLTLLDGVSEQVRFGVSAGAFAAWRGAGATLLGTGSTSVSTNVWYFMEFKVTIHPSAGVVQIKQDGTTILNLTGQNTRATANSQANGFSLGMLSTISGDNMWFDDLYVLDDQGTVNNTFLGDQRVYTLYPSGAGAHTDWTPSAGANYTDVDETTPNSDTDYVSSSTVGNIDSYAYGDLPAAVSAIAGVQFNHIARKDDAGTRQIAAFQRNGSAVEAVGATQTVTSSYTDLVTLSEQSLSNAGNAWTASEINGSEFGTKVIA